jgi:hypothetical protein
MLPLSPPKRSAGHKPAKSRVKSVNSKKEKIYFNFNILLPPLLHQMHNIVKKVNK